MISSILNWEKHYNALCLNVKIRFVINDSSDFDTAFWIAKEWEILVEELDKIVKENQNFWLNQNDESLRAYHLDICLKQICEFLEVCSLSEYIFLRPYFNLNMFEPRKI